MPYDSECALPWREALGSPSNAPLLYLLPARAGHEAGADDLVAAEIAELRQLGRAVVPFLIGLDRHVAEARLTAETVRPSGAAPVSAMSHAFKRPFGLTRAVRLALRQGNMPAGEAMALGARVATAATRWGGSAIHAAGIDAGTTAALIGGRLAGLPVSLAAQSAAETPDLSLQLGAADLVVASSRALAVALAALAPEARIHVVPQGLDAAWFRAEQTAPRNGRLLCLAPLVQQAGLATLIAALALLPAQARPVVDVIGAGPLLETLRADALDAGVSDHHCFLGTRGRAWVASEASRYGGLVSPGSGHEQVPMAVLQAMALELPVLATALPVMLEVVPADAGYLVPPDNVETLAQGLRWLSAMPEEQRRRYGAAGRDRLLHGMTLTDRAAALARLLPS